MASRDEERTVVLGGPFATKRDDLIHQTVAQLLGVFMAMSCKGVCKPFDSERFAGAIPAFDGAVGVEAESIAWRESHGLFVVLRILHNAEHESDGAKRAAGVCRRGVVQRLRMAGVDMASTEPVEAAFATLARMVSRLEELTAA